MVIFEHGQMLRNIFTISAGFWDRFSTFSQSSNFAQNEIFGSRTELPSAFFFSSSDIILYTPGYLRVSWGTLRQFKTKRIEAKFSKTVFSVARPPSLPHLDCSGSTTELHSSLYESFKMSSEAFRNKMIFKLFKKEIFGSDTELPNAVSFLHLA